MAETYDLILKRATVVNQDGEGVGDLGIRAGDNGMSVTGWPTGNFVRGRKVMWESESTGPWQP